MQRSDHQPVPGAPKRPRRPKRELEAVCGKCLAFILAIDVEANPVVVNLDEPNAGQVICESAALPADASSGGEPIALPRPLQLYEGRPLVAHALANALAAQVAGVVVLADEGISRDVEASVASELSRLRRGSAANVKVLSVSKADLEKRTYGASCFSICEIPYGVLGVMAEELELCEGADCAMLLSALMPRVTKDHIFELVADWRDGDPCDIISSWIMWLRRPPYLYSRTFLEGLGASELVKPCNSHGDRPVPQLALRDHVFGEEMLAVNEPEPSGVGAFLNGCSISALEAVSKARELGASKATPRKNAPDSSDDVLIDIAASVISRLAKGVGKREAQALSRADAFGQRNKRDFPLLCDRRHANKLSYLDSAATAQRLGAALDAQADFDRHENANVYRGGYDLSMQATFTLNDSRARVEDFIGSGRRRMIYTANATDSCSLVALAWGERNIGEGDLIVTTIAEHHSNMLPFTLLAARKGARVEFVGIKPDGRLDMDAYDAIIRKRPKLVCVAQIGNVLGILNPVDEMIAKAHVAGARVLVDAAQSMPHMAIDVQKLGADFVAFSAHKLYGPMGIGGLWTSEDAFNEMDPLSSGGGAVSHVGANSYYLRRDAIQYELGTPAVSQAVGFAAAIDYLDFLGMEEVAAHGAALARLLVKGLHMIPGVTVWGDHSKPDGQTGLVTFTLCGVAPAALAKFLGRLGVCIRSGGHCALPLHAKMGLLGTGRVSFGVYNTVADVEALLVAVDACRRANGLFLGHKSF